MKAIILAGGEGTRLREIIKEIPKPMAPIAGKPFLEYLVLELAKWNINEIVLAIGYKGGVIKSYFGNGKKWNTDILYSEEKKMLGTGGALREASRLINDEQFVVMNGDSILEVDFNDLSDFHKKNDAIVTVGLVNVDDAARYGRVGINKKGEVEGFIEKGTEGYGLINGGVYIFNHEIIKAISSGTVSLEREVLPSLIKKGLYGMVIKGFFVDIGMPVDYINLFKNPEKLIEI